MPQHTTTNKTASSIMDSAAALLNDSAKAVFTYDAQLPYLKIAGNELQEHMALANMQVTEVTSAEITVPIGTTEIKPKVDAGGTNSNPTYPADLIEIERVWVRLAGSSDPFIPVNYVRWLNQLDAGIVYNSIYEYSFQNNTIKFRPSSNEQEIKLDYIRSVFPNPLTKDSVIGIINAESFLTYRTAALCAEFIGENPTRASSLNINAVMAVERMTGIDVKGRQKVGVRRRPFMSSLKNRIRNW